VAAPAVIDYVRDMKHVGLGLVALSACTLTKGSLGSGSNTTTAQPVQSPARGVRGHDNSGGEDRIVAMPSLILMTRAEAEGALRRAGFSRPLNIDNQSICGSTLDDHKTIIELDRVCYQHPAPGQETRTTASISIRIQTENPWRGPLSGDRFWFLMPDLTGVDVEVAKAKLRELGFTSKDVRISFTDECAPNLVCKTYPEKLTRTDNTSDKVFYVGRAPDRPTPAKPPDPPPAPATPATPTKPPDIF
jgi:beta-lactam-binding protein with PASTA domain